MSTARNRGHRGWYSGERFARQADLRQIFLRPPL